MRRLLTLSATLLLVACSAGEPARPAALTPAQPAHADFGTLRLRYHALPASSLTEAAARTYGVARDDATGVIMIGLREVSTAPEATLTGKVSATATDLQGERQPIALRKVRSGEYVDYVGSFHISPRNSYRFEVEVEAQGKREQLKFQREF